MKARNFIAAMCVSVCLGSTPETGRLRDADRLYAAGDFAGVKKVLAGADPEAVATLLRLGAVELMLGDLRAAESAYVRALRRCDAARAERRLILGGLVSVYVQSKKLTKAERFAREAAEGSKAAGPLQNLAAVYQAEGKVADAKALYRQALAVANGTREAASIHHNLAMLRGTEGDLSGALAEVEAAVALRRKEAGQALTQSLILLAWIDCRMHRWDKAETALEEAAGDGSTSVSILDVRASIYEHTGRKREARRLRDEVQAISRSDLTVSLSELSRSR